MKSKFVSGATNIFGMMILFSVGLAEGQTESLPLSRSAPRAAIVGIPWELREAAQKNGDRLTKAGKERLVLMGDVKNVTSGQTLGITIVREDGDKLRIDLASGDKVTLNGIELGKTNSASLAFNEKLAESVFEDFPDTFFLNFQSERKAVLLAGRARPEGTDPLIYRGPYFNIYGIGREDRLRNVKTRINKLYYFDFETQLLGRVEYRGAAGQAPSVTTIFEDYRSIDDQLIPFRIRRLENGQESLLVTIRSVLVTAKQNDNSFKAN